MTPKPKRSLASSKRSSSPCSTRLTPPVDEEVVAGRSAPLGRGEGRRRRRRGVDDLGAGPEDLGERLLLADADPAVQLGPVRIALPLIGSPMPDVCGPEMCRALAEEGTIGILHRFQTIEECKEQGLTVATLNGSAAQRLLAKRKVPTHPYDDQDGPYKALVRRDADAVLLRVESVAGIACHTGRRRCFFNRLEGADAERRWVETDPVIASPSTFSSMERMWRKLKRI